MTSQPKIKNPIRIDIRAHTVLRRNLRSCLSRLTLRNLLASRKLTNCELMSLERLSVWLMVTSFRRFRRRKNDFRKMCRIAFKCRLAEYSLSGKFYRRTLCLSQSLNRKVVHIWRFPPWPVQVPPDEIDVLIVVFDTFHLWVNSHTLVGN